MHQQRQTRAEVGQKRKVLHRRFSEREGEAPRARDRGKQKPKKEAPRRVEPPKEDKPQLDRRRAFIEAYCTNGFNATQAAIAAGYSERSARMTGARMMSNDDVRSAIEEFQAKQTERTEITVDRLTDMLLDDYRQAKALEQTTAATNAVNSIAKLHGLLTEDRKNARMPLRDFLDKLDEVESKKPRLKVVGGTG